jgi:hypothetical protein
MCFPSVKRVESGEWRVEMKEEPKGNLYRRLF